MNFAEQLAYWYLRLNGFFPISNFVLHQGADGRRTGDADIVAVRFPHVHEEIGGNAHDWDMRFGDEWEIDLSSGIVGLVVEVKSGQLDVATLTDARRTEMISRCIRRMGIFPPRRWRSVSTALSTASIHRSGNVTTAKLLISRDPIAATTPWLSIGLADVETFICNRMRRYDHRKASDRFFFPGELIQYLAWKGGVELD